MPELRLFRPDDSPHSEQGLLFEMTAAFGWKGDAVAMNIGPIAGEKTEKGHHMAFCDLEVVGDVIQRPITKKQVGTVSALREVLARGESGYQVEA